MSEYCSTHFKIKLYRTLKHTNIRIVSGILFIYQDVIIGYVNLRAKMKASEVYILWECRNNTKVLAVLEPWMLVAGLGTERSDRVKKGCKISY